MVSGVDLLDFGDWKSWVLVGLTCRRRNSSISGSRYEAAFVPRMVACPCLPRHPDHLWIDFVLVDVRAELMSPGRWSCDFPALFRIDVVFVDVSVVPFPRAQLLSRSCSNKHTYELIVVRSLNL